jgi:hypothetical protein
MRAFLSSPYPNPFGRERAAWTPEMLSATGGRPTLSAAAEREARAILAITEPTPSSYYGSPISPGWKDVRSWYCDRLAESLERFINVEIS